MTLRQTDPLNPDYQMPGRNELTNVNDAFGKRNAVQQAILDRHMAKGNTFQNAAKASLDGSKLHQASRKESSAAASEVANLPADPVPAARSSKAPSEAAKSAKAPSEAAASHKSQA